MARLIDAEHLKRWILARWEKTDPRSAYPLRAIDIIDQVDREDTIDAEPVIRCKDCEYYNGEDKYCVNDIFAKSNGYCMYGKEKDE